MAISAGERRQERGGGMGECGSIQDREMRLGRMSCELSKSVHVIGSIARTTT